MKVALTFIIVLIVALAVSWFYISTLQKRVDGLENVPPRIIYDTTYIECEPITVVKKVYVDSITTSSLVDTERAGSRWRYTPELVKLIDTVNTGKYVHFVEMDTSLENIGDVYVKYYFPPVSMFLFEFKPIITQVETKIIEERKSKWLFTTGMMVGRGLSQDYRIAMQSSLFYRSFGVSGLIDSEGLWMVGLNKRW